MGDARRLKREGCLRRMAPRPTRGSVWNVPAAAEHEQPAAAEHGTNIAFANMDWKKGRHTGTIWKVHRATWQRTTEEIIRVFNPAVICFCEVGEVSNSLEAKHFDEL